MDGISSGVLGHAGLSELGFDVAPHLPDYRRGHEFAPEDVAEIHAKWPDTRLLLACDGGVNPHRGIAAARALGWPTLVTDHHEELAPGSTADITVAPCRIDETHTHTGICGAHVLYPAIEAYTRVHRPEKLWEIRLLRVAAPKTIPNPWGGFDVDPDAVDIEQSILMQLLRAEPHHPVFLRAHGGFAIVLKTFAQVGKIRDVDDRDEGLFGFCLAPAKNSPRRTGAALEPCFAVFTADGAERPPGRRRQPACRPRRFRQRFRPRAEVVRHHHQPGAARRSQRHRAAGGPKGDLVLGPDADCDAGREDLRPLFEPVRLTEGLKPFGHGSTTPVVEIVIESWGPCVDRIGSDPQQLRQVTRSGLSGLSCLWWNVAEEKFDVIQSFVQRAGRTRLGTLRFTATSQPNTFRGDTRVQTVINEQITTGF
ncbi:hypothetical protein [Streptomyces sp. NPDC059533]|uniref:hypothetical protein n=1 Tax=unclassified Streptomyces TaxID=2593676 RepID=UPI0036C1B586